MEQNRNGATAFEILDEQIKWVPTIADGKEKRSRPLRVASSRPTFRAAIHRTPPTSTPRFEKSPPA